MRVMYAMVKTCNTTSWGADIPFGHTCVGTLCLVTLVQPVMWVLVTHSLVAAGGYTFVGAGTAVTLFRQLCRRCLRLLAGRRKVKPTLFGRTYEHRH
jgi:hypothetical protein